MDSPTPPSITPTIEDKLAALCERPHLSSDVLPRFVLILLERALHSVLCSFAACLMELVKQYRAGTLEPWPDDFVDVASEPRRSRYKMKSPPAAPMCGAGAQHVQAPAAVSLEAASETAPAMDFDARETAAMPIAAILPPRQVWPSRIEAQQLSHAVRVRPWERFGPQPDRCRSASVFSAAEGRLQNCAQIVPVS